MKNRHGDLTNISVGVQSFVSSGSDTILSKTYFPNKCIDVLFLYYINRSVETLTI